MKRRQVVDGAFNQNKMWYMEIDPVKIHRSEAGFSVEMIKKITKPIILKKNIGSQQDFQLATTVSKHI